MKYQTFFAGRYWNEGNYEIWQRGNRVIVRWRDGSETVATYDPREARKRFEKLRERNNVAENT